VIFPFTTGDRSAPRRRKPPSSATSPAAAGSSASSRVRQRLHLGRYGQLVGSLRQATPGAAERAHQDRGSEPSLHSWTATQFTRFDEWYDFRTTRAQRARPDHRRRSSYSGSTMGADHPTTCATTLTAAGPGNRARPHHRQAQRNQLPAPATRRHRNRGRHRPRQLRGRRTPIINLPRNSKIVTADNEPPKGCRGRRSGDSGGSPGHHRKGGVDRTAAPPRGRCRGRWLGEDRRDQRPLLDQRMRPVSVMADVGGVIGEPERTSSSLITNP